MGCNCGKKKPVIVLPKPTTEEKPKTDEEQ